MAPWARWARLAEGPFFGVDVGGTKVAAGLIDGSRVTDESEQPTDLSGAEALLDEIAAAVDGLVERHGQPAGIGVGFPSQIDFDAGVVVSSVNIPLDGVPVREQLEHRFGVPVVVDNDANCAALAEAAVEDVDHLVMLTLGTGVGGGVVLDGKIFRGADGMGGELGHFPVAGRWARLPRQLPRPRLPGGAVQRHRAGARRDRSRQGRPRFRVWASATPTTDGCRAWRRWRPPSAATRPRWSCSIASAATWGWGSPAFVNIFQPRRVAIGGGLSRAHELFLERAIEEAGSRSLPRLWERTEVRLAQGGHAAGADRRRGTGPAGVWRY